MEQAQVHGCAFAQLCKMAPGGIGVAGGFPAAAAGKAAAAVLNKAHHIGQRIAQKHADLMRELRRAAEPPGQKR